MLCGGWAQWQACGHRILHGLSRTCALLPGPGVKVFQSRTPVPVVAVHMSVEADMLGLSIPVLGPGGRRGVAPGLGELHTAPGGAHALSGGLLQLPGGP